MGRPALCSFRTASAEVMRIFPTASGLLPSAFSSFATACAQLPCSFSTASTQLLRSAGAAASLFWAAVAAPRRPAREACRLPSMLLHASHGVPGHPERGARSIYGMGRDAF